MDQAMHFHSVVLGGFLRHEACARRSDEGQTWVSVDGAFFIDDAHTYLVRAAFDPQ